MNLITFILSPHMAGPAVANLQSALQALLARSLILKDDAAARQELLDAISHERESQTFDDATAKAVSFFQQDHGLASTGEVDQATADALNAVLRELGLLEEEARPRPGAVAGRVTLGDGQPFAGVVRAFHVAERGLVRLGEDETDGDGNYTIRYEALPGVSAIRLRIVVLDGTGSDVQSLDSEHDAAPLELVDLSVPFIQPPAAERHVEGRVVFDHGLPATALTLRLYRLGFGGAAAATKVAETTTLEEGLYRLSYASADPLSLEVRAVDASGKEFPLTSMIKSAGEKEVLTLVAPSEIKPLAAEFSRLSADLTPRVGGTLGDLAKARENSEQRDITILHEATGWDARLIAMAAQAAQLSRAEETGLPHDVLYGVLRVGLPSDKQQLARVGVEAFEQALSKARGAGIVELDDATADAAKKAFTAVSAKICLALTAPGSKATYGELLQQAGLGDDDQQTFLSLAMNHRNAPESLWENAASAGLAASIPKLRRQGQLALLTTSEPGLMNKLEIKLGDASPAKLVELGLYNKEPWLEFIDQVPPAYQAAPDPKVAYALDNARKIRISYPTEVTWHSLKTGEFEFQNGNDKIASLLKNAIDKGFKLGETPISAFLKENPDVFEAGTSADERATTTQLLNTLQRVYQITPSNEAMKALFNAGLLSAHDVLAYSFDEFIERFVGPDLSEAEARLVYRKAEQVSNVSQSLFMLAKELDNSPPVAALSGTGVQRQNAKQKLIAQFPTMTSLFGSFDYAECDDCQSVIGPAAYFVDLLQFINPEPQIWNNAMGSWKAKHGGFAYPFKDQDAIDAWKGRHPDEGEPKIERTPFEVLTERRPDLPHIELTCENTSTALPQIDIVNEILEYYVANGQLEADAARDIGTATSEELLAEPRNVIGDAYTALQVAKYPLRLPFDLWLETARQFSAYFDVPFWRVLAAFTDPEKLFAEGFQGARCAVFFESLGLSPDELAIFTNPNPLPGWFELYGYASEERALTQAKDENGERVDLNSAKALSRRLAVTYKELVEVIQAGFVNPDLDKLLTLRKLGLSVNDLLLYRADVGLLQSEEGLSPAELTRQAEVKAIQERMDAATRRFRAANPDFNARDWVKASLEANAFDGVLVLASLDETGVDFDSTILRYANDKPIDAIALLRINVFVRLWRKLGWSIEEVDRALQTFVPKNAKFEAAHLDAAPLRTTLVYIAHLNDLATRLGWGKRSRVELLTLWAPLPTTGRQPLYAQLFLKRDVLESDAVFDDPLGQYLTNPAEKLKHHLLALQGALGLTVSDIAAILRDDKQSVGDPTGADTDNDAVLSLDNVSLLYRTKLLANALKLSIADFLVLQRLSGIDPFEPLSLDPLETLDQDRPWQQTLAFVDAANEVSASGFSLTDLDYLLSHRFDPVGKLRPDEGAMLSVTLSIARGIAAIRRDHGMPAKPETIGEQKLRQELGLLLPPDVVDKLFAVMAGSVEFIATLEGVTTALDPALFVQTRFRIASSYDGTRQMQRIAVRGMVFEADRDSLKASFVNAIAGMEAPPDLQDQCGRLLEDVEHQAKEFLSQHVERQTETPTSTGFLDPGDQQSLFKPFDASNGNDAKLEPDSLRKRKLLAAKFFPFLQAKLIRDLVVKALIGANGVDPVLLEALVSDVELLTHPDEPAEPLLAAFSQSAEAGVSVSFFREDEPPTSPASELTPDEATTTDVTTAIATKPADTNSASFRGYLQVPVAGAYRFYASLEAAGAEAQLSFAHLPTPLFNGAPEVGKEISEYIELKPGVPYQFVLTLRKLQGGNGSLSVQADGLRKGPLDRLELYPQAALDRSVRAQILLAKVLQLASTFGFSERELRYIAEHPDDFEALSFSHLPTRKGDFGPVLFGQWRRLAAYASLKRELALTSDQLIDVFEAPTPEEARIRIAELVRRDANVVQAAAVSISAGDMRTARGLSRLWTVLQLTETFAVPPSTMAAWTGLVEWPSTDEERQRRAGLASDMRNALRARFEPEAWQRVARRVSDKLRQRQRDALVAHVMHQRGFARIEQLFEYFLIDPGAEPVLQTSRLRAATSAVQIFINRCLFGLEPEVPPSAINSKQWQWMKRYSVWAGNRKLFLFPENVLEPEFRDDKTHLFRELEGKLLQGDVTSDLVEDAFLGYLRNLDEIARLEIVAMYCEQDPYDPLSNQIHVLGRTYGEPHKYFYRRYSTEWTPWEPMPVDIQGDHIVLVVWRDRLNVFWATFMDQPDPSQNSGSSESSDAQSIAQLSVSAVASAANARRTTKVVTVQLHWSEYLDGAWSVRTSSGVDASISKPVPLSFVASNADIYATKEYERSAERAVQIHIGGQIACRFELTSRNSRPEVGPSVASPPALPYSGTWNQASLQAGKGELTVSFLEKTYADDGQETATPRDQGILQQVQSYTILSCAGSFGLVVDSKDPDASEIASLIAPIFYQDSLNTFFIEPTFKERTTEEWIGWVPVPPDLIRVEDEQPWAYDLLTRALVPREVAPKRVNPEDPSWHTLIDPRASVSLPAQQDWLVNPSTVIHYDEGLIAATGRASLALKLAMDNRQSVGLSGVASVPVRTGGAISSTVPVVAAVPEALSAVGLDPTLNVIRIVGNGGLNSALSNFIQPPNPVWLEQFR